LSSPPSNTTASDKKNISVPQHCSVQADVESDFAFLKAPDGKLWVGIGPFETAAEAPVESAFYINDFSLSDNEPWKIPRQLLSLNTEAAQEWAKKFRSFPRPQVNWKPLEPEWFEMVFRRIRKEVVARRLKKMVPVLTELGTKSRGDMISLVENVLSAPDSLAPYGRVVADSGFIGATPELLLNIAENSLETMALAGTASPVHASGFTSDVKEIEEHEHVVSFMQAVLKEFGEVNRYPREVSDAAGLTHFRTRFSMTLDKSGLSLNDLIRSLHPTPAVGCLPRDDHQLEKLMEYRKQLNTPGFFGAPFGLKTGETFYSVVAIRGIGWEGDHVFMPSGCGIVGGSVFDHEWRELGLKRDTVARMLKV